jgi:hypothetical protein
LTFGFIKNPALAEHFIHDLQWIDIMPRLLLGELVDRKGPAVAVSAPGPVTSKGPTRSQISDAELTPEEKARASLLKLAVAFVVSVVTKRLESGGETLPSTYDILTKLMDAVADYGGWNAQTVCLFRVLLSATVLKATTFAASIQGRYASKSWKQMWSLFDVLELFLVYTPTTDQLQQTFRYGNVGFHLTGFGLSEDGQLLEKSLLAFRKLLPAADEALKIADATSNPKRARALARLDTCIAFLQLVIDFLADMEKSRQAPEARIKQITALLCSNRERREKKSGMTSRMSSPLVRKTRKKDMRKKLSGFLDYQRFVFLRPQNVPVCMA